LLILVGLIDGEREKEDARSVSSRTVDDTVLEGPLGLGPGSTNTRLDMWKLRLGFCQFFSNVDMIWDRELLN